MLRPPRSVWCTAVGAQSGSGGVICVIRVFPPQEACDKAGMAQWVVTRGWSFLQILYCGGFQIQWEIESIWQATLNSSPRLLRFAVLTLSHVNTSVHPPIHLPIHLLFSAFPRWWRIHLPIRSHRRLGFDPWVRKIPGRRKYQPTSVFLPGVIPWTEEPGGLQSMVLQSVGHDWKCIHSNAFTPFLKYFYLIIMK